MEKLSGTEFLFCAGVNLFTINYIFPDKYSRVPEKIFAVSGSLNLLIVLSPTSGAMRRFLGKQAKIAQSGR